MNRFVMPISITPLERLLVRGNFDCSSSWLPSAPPQCFVLILTATCRADFFRVCLGVGIYPAETTPVTVSVFGPLVAPAIAGTDGKALRDRLGFLEHRFRRDPKIPENRA